MLTRDVSISGAIATLYQIGSITFYSNFNKACKDGKLISLEPKVAQLLELFCRYPNQLLSREFLINQLWEQAYVSDGSLNRLVHVLRRKLICDNAGFIKALYKNGYIFVGNPAVRHIPFESAVSEKSIRFLLGMENMHSEDIPLLL